MSKSEEIIKDYNEAKALYRSRFKLTHQNITMLEIVQALIDKIDDLEDDLKIWRK